MNGSCKPDGKSTVASLIPFSRITRPTDHGCVLLQLEMESDGAPRKATNLGFADPNNRNGGSS